MIEAIPLALDASGVLRVANSRVTLDLIVRAFNRGATAEEIAQDFPSLELSDIYQVIGYYLKHGPELQQYLDAREATQRATLAENAECWSPPGLRQRLLSRRKTL